MPPPTDAPHSIDILTALLLVLNRSAFVVLLTGTLGINFGTPWIVLTCRVFYGVRFFGLWLVHFILFRIVVAVDG